MQSSIQLKAMFVVLGLVLGVLFVLGVRGAWQRTGASDEDTHKASVRALLGTALWLTVTMGAAAAHRLRFEPPTFMEGIMPVQMSYSGYNFDIVTGSLAIVLAVAVALGYAGVRLVLLWNCLGSLLLANVLIIAVLSTPLFQAFDTQPLNIWVTQPPYVWLPAVMVPMALIGHIVVFRRLRMQAELVTGDRAVGRSGGRAIGRSGDRE